MSAVLAEHTIAPQPTLHVRTLVEQDARWDAFVHACPEATFFHLSGWKSVIEGAFGHRTYFLYAERAGHIVAVLPLAEIKSRLFGHSLSSLPFCVYGGVAGTDCDARLALDTAAWELAQRLGADHLEYRSRARHHAAWLEKNLYVTFRKEISGDPEKNLAQIPRKQRAMVRKGIAGALQSERDGNVERFFAAYSESVHRLGTPVFSRQYFETLLKVFGKNCEILTVTKNGRLIASVMSFYFRDEVLPYYGGGTVAAREFAGNDFMYWELMRRAGEKGIRIFDYGRSKVGTGSFDFKKNWGFQPEPLHYEYRVHKGKGVPDVNPLNPKYQLFIKLWRKLPLRLVNAIGPHVAKSLG